MKSAMFEVNISANGNTMLVSIMLSATVDEEALDALVIQLLRAFDELQPPGDATDHEELMKAMTISGSGAGRRLIIPCRYSDPSYPDRFEKALRRLSVWNPLLH
jgi:hypothetical protein